MLNLLFGESFQLNDVKLFSISKSSFGFGLKSVYGICCESTGRFEFWSGSISKLKFSKFSGKVILDGSMLKLVLMLLSVTVLRPSLLFPVRKAVDEFPLLPFSGRSTKPGVKDSTSTLLALCASSRCG